MVDFLYAYRWVLIPLGVAILLSFVARVVLVRRSEKGGPSRLKTWLAEVWELILGS